MILITISYFYFHKCHCKTNSMNHLKYPKFISVKLLVNFKGRFFRIRTPSIQPQSLSLLYGIFGNHRKGKMVTIMYHCNGKIKLQIALTTALKMQFFKYALFLLINIRFLANANLLYCMNKISFHLL